MENKSENKMRTHTREAYEREKEAVVTNTHAASVGCRLTRDKFTDDVTLFVRVAPSAGAFCYLDAEDYFNGHDAP